MEALPESDAELLGFVGADNQLLGMDVRRQPVAAPPELENGSLQADCSIRFMVNDLDAAVQRAKKMNKSKKPVKIRGKKKKKKLEKMDPRIFVARTSRVLKESKRYPVAAAVERLGIRAVHNLVLEVNTIEENGGHMTLDGNRQRSRGGIFWNILRSRYKDDYRAIMAAARTHKKQRRQHKQEKQKRKLENVVMVVDGQPVMVIDGEPTRKRRRRRRDFGMAPQREEVSVWPSRHTQDDDKQAKVDPENSSTPMQAQSAWAEGVDKEMLASCSDDVEMLDDTIRNRDSSLVAEQRFKDLLEA